MILDAIQLSTKEISSRQRICMFVASIKSLQNIQIKIYIHLLCTTMFKYYFFHQSTQRRLINDLCVCFENNSIFIHEPMRVVHSMTAARDHAINEVTKSVRNINYT